MIKDAILDVTIRGDVVLDCFCGAGTTLVAAHRAQRIGMGIEIDPIYVDAAVGRMEEVTVLSDVRIFGTTGGVNEGLLWRTCVDVKRRVGCAASGDAEGFAA